VWLLEHPASPEKDVPARPHLLEVALEDLLKPLVLEWSVGLGMPVAERADDVEDLPPVDREPPVVGRLVVGPHHLLPADGLERAPRGRIHRRPIAGGLRSALLGLNLPRPRLANLAEALGDVV
jgi:hypothetical protein